jgi:hypothetical protein
VAVAAVGQPAAVAVAAVAVAAAAQFPLNRVLLIGDLE